jgi:hypothetical protein
LPDRHIDNDSKDTVRLVMGLIATMAALVLSLLISSANSSYDTQAAGLRQMSSDIAQLDRMLVLYGPEAQEIRGMLRQAVIAAHPRVWPSDGSQPPNLDPSLGRAQTDAFFAKLHNLTPKTAAQSRAQDAALQLAATLTKMRILMYEQLGGSVSGPLLAVLIFWVSVLFLGFSLFCAVPRHTYCGVADWHDFGRRRDFSRLGVEPSLFGLDPPFGRAHPQRSGQHGSTGAARRFFLGGNPDTAAGIARIGLAGGRTSVTSGRS